jgi:hypothetical protein
MNASALNIHNINTQSKHKGLISSSIAQSEVFRTEPVLYIAQGSDLSDVTSS